MAVVPSFIISSQIKGIDLLFKRTCRFSLNDYRSERTLPSSIKYRDVRIFFWTSCSIAA